MFVSIFDLFSIGIGPSSSHTIGPMRAAHRFISEMKNNISFIDSIKVELFGSLALTGRGHGTVWSVMLGFEGEKPEEIDPEKISERIDHIKKKGTLNLLGRRSIVFSERENIVFNYKELLPLHSNAMRFTCYDKKGKELQNHMHRKVQVIGRVENTKDHRKMITVKSYTLLDERDACESGDDQERSIEAPLFAFIIFIFYSLLDSPMFGWS